MKSKAELTTHMDSGWIRVSSRKPYLARLLVTGLTAFCLLIISRHKEWLFLLVATVSTVATILAILTWKIVERRQNDYRIITLFYSEVVPADEVCMTVKKPGSLWPLFRIHLCKPARSGWVISFVPTGEHFNNNS